MNIEKDRLRMTVFFVVFEFYFTDNLVLVCYK